MSLAHGNFNIHFELIHWPRWHNFKGHNLILWTLLRKLLEDFAESCYQFKHDISVVYEAKKRLYGVKLLVTLESIRNGRNGDLIMKTLLKIRTVGQLPMLEHIISALNDCIKTYLLDISPPTTDSDTDSVIIMD